MLRGSLTGRATRHCAELIAHDEQVSVVLCIYLSVGPDGQRCVRRAERKLQELFLLERAALIDGEDVAVLAVGVNHPVTIYAEGVDAPLEAVRVIINARHRPIRLPRATERVRVLEFPLDVHVVVELRDEVSLRVVWCDGCAVGRAKLFDVAVRPGCVVVVFDDNRVGSAVRVDRGRYVPSEGVGALKLPCRAEFEEVALRVVVKGEDTEEDAAVGRDGGRGRAVVEDSSWRRLVRARVNARVGAHAAAAGRTVGRYQNIAAVVEPPAQRGRPLWR